MQSHGKVACMLRKSRSRARVMTNFAALLTIAPSSMAWSAPNPAEESYLLSAGAGVSAPSLYNGLRDNPAVVSFTSGLRLQALGLASSSAITPTTAGVHVILGNGMVGGQFGMELTVPGAFAPALRGAVAVSIRAIKTAVGLSCQVGLGSAVSVSCANLGLLFNPSGPFRVGLALGLSGLGGGGFPVAIGAAVEIAKLVTLAVDGGTTIGGASTSVDLLPAAKVRIAMFQFSAGYGLGAWAGFTLGVGALLGKSFHLMAHYNHGTWGLISAVFRF